MAGVALTEIPKGGFSFELCKRLVFFIVDRVYVHMLVDAGMKRAGIGFPKPIKTGTTIAGVVYKVLLRNSLCTDILRLGNRAGFGVLDRFKGSYTV